MEPDAILTRSEFETHLPYLTASSRPETPAGVPRPKDKMTATSKPFPYTRLQDNEIRLLRISIDPDSNLLICNFDVRDLTASRGTYKAISYCWGDPEPRHSVLCTTGDHLNLTESAAEVLRFVVSRDSEDWYWIDQICINQEDLVERSAQVSIMGQVYSSTRQVGLSARLIAFWSSFSSWRGPMPTIIIPSTCSQPYIRARRRKVDGPIF